MFHFLLLRRFHLRRFVFPDLHSFHRWLNALSSSILTFSVFFFMEINFFQFRFISFISWNYFQYRNQCFLVSGRSRPQILKKMEKIILVFSCVTVALSCSLEKVDLLTNKHSHTYRLLKDSMPRKIVKLETYKMNMCGKKFWIRTIVPHEQVMRKPKIKSADNMFLCCRKNCALSYWTLSFIRIVSMISEQRTDENVSLPLLNNNFIISIIVS